MEKELYTLVKDLSKIRLYSACGVDRGVMVRDKEKVFNLVKKARKLIEETEHISCDICESIQVLTITPAEIYLDTDDLGAVAPI
jgi:hypothetical protein